MSVFFFCLFFLLIIQQNASAAQFSSNSTDSLRSAADGEPDCGPQTAESDCTQTLGCIWENGKCGECPIYKAENEQAHVLCDELCIQCHEWFSEQDPNMRAECSANCYHNEAFKKCLNIFKPPMLMELMRAKKL